MPELSGFDDPGKQGQVSRNVSAGSSAKSRNKPLCPGLHEWESKPMEKRSKTSERARAATRDVVGIKIAERINPKWRENYDALVKTRTRLLERKGVLVRDSSEESPAFGLHMADAATDTYDRDFALGIATSEQNVLYEIDEAL